MANFKLTIEYDGTAYHGWQRQKNQPTVQAQIENALGIMTRTPIRIIGSGRTDAGVHALGQVANFHSAATIPAPAYPKGLNSLLPDDIVIVDCTRVPSSFHARFDALGKCYHYRILNRATPSALQRRYAWHLRRPLNIDAMGRAAAMLLGEHDFKSFEGSGSPRSHTVRQITHADFTEQTDGLLVFKIRGNGFLRFMVRNIVSTLASVGMAKISPDEFGRIMASKNRSLAGPTAPPQGLFLVSVDYGPQSGG